jgi:lysine 2,3-aminomutase
MNARDLSIKRGNILQSKTTHYREFKNQQLKIMEERQRETLQLKSKLLNFFNASMSDWYDWKWQVNHRIKDIETLQKFIQLTDQEIEHITTISNTNRFASTPYYLSLIVKKNDPIQMLSIPSVNELICDEGEADPMDEEHTNPAGSITRRYPDRLIINVTNQCAMYCRHCQRRRLISTVDHHTSKALLEESYTYIKNHPEIRDVLLTGGDALLLPDDYLESILQELRAIPHVEIIRIGSRTPVTMPMRITDALVNMLKKYHPIYLNTHFNHGYEVTEDAKKACEKLVDNGIVVGNQAVLLKGVNDHPFTMTFLNQQLLTCRVRPYYIFHAKNVIGTTHFIPKLSDGLKIMEFMRGNTSGLAIPTYIMNAPKGLGKVPLLPEYIIDHKNGSYTIRTWENNTFTYKEK